MKEGKQLNINPYLTSASESVIYDFIGNEDLLDAYELREPLSHIEIQSELNQRNKIKSETNA